MLMYTEGENLTSFGYTADMKAYLIFGDAKACLKCGNQFIPVLEIM